MLDVHSKECECMPHRRAIRAMKDSGLADHMRRFSYENYETPTDETKKAKQKAQLFLRSNASGFLISGQSGSGKTHLCTAMCHDFVTQGYKLHYMKWREEAPELKGLQSEPGVRNKINSLINVPVLYIDDFFKGNTTPADVDLAFLIINGRYIRPDSKTIISTELPPIKLVELDEAVGGRILEMSKGFVIEAPHENWRIK